MRFVQNVLHVLVRERHKSIPSDKGVMHRCCHDIPSQEVRQCCVGVSWYLTHYQAVTSRLGPRKDRVHDSIEVIRTTFDYPAICALIGHRVRQIFHRPEPDDRVYPSINGLFAKYQKVHCVNKRDITAGVFPVAHVHLTQVVVTVASI